MALSQAGRTSWPRRLLRDTEGAAAVEIALWATALVAPVFGVADLSNYIFKKMQVEAAAQAAAERAFVMCNSSGLLPAVSNCTGLKAALVTAAQSTSLAANVTIGNPVEGYYCASNSSVLTLIGSTGTTNGTTSTAPSLGGKTNCSTVVTTATSVTPSDYLQVTATYTFAPMFRSLPFSALLPTNVSKTVWMRMSG